MTGFIHTPIYFTPPQPGSSLSHIATARQVPVYQNYYQYCYYPSTTYTTVVGSHPLPYYPIGYLPTTTVYHPPLQGPLVVYPVAQGFWMPHQNGGMQHHHHPPAPAANHGTGRKKSPAGRGAAPPAEGQRGVSAAMPQPAPQPASAGAEAAETSSSSSVAAAPAMSAEGGERVPRDEVEEQRGRKKTRADNVEDMETDHVRDIEGADAAQRAGAEKYQMSGALDGGGLTRED